MRAIKVYWTDTEMVDHEFKMQVPANDTKPNADHLWTQFLMKLLAIMTGVIKRGN